MLKWAIASLGSVTAVTVITFGLVINHFSQPAPKDILGAYNETRYQLSSSVSGRLTNQVYDLIDRAKPTPSDSPLPDTIASSSTEQMLMILNQRLSAQERAMAELQTNDRGSASSSTYLKPADEYIPIGIGGSTSSTDWTVVNTQQIDIDPADYPGMIGAYFTVELQVKDGNGKAYARLFNVTDNTPVYSSEVSTSNSDFAPVTSGSFTFPSGKKTYRLQLKSLTGYQVDVQLSKIKISF